MIRFGAPAGQPPGYSHSSRSGLGELTRGTVRLLAISTPDPVGGPAWGMRVFSTTRGVGCIQVGRLVDGRLGALGQDGAFHDDGLFHELGASTFAPFYNCATLDANRRLFTNVAVGDEPASGWGFVGRYAHGGCVPATSSPAERAGAPTICPQGDERNLYYGLLGPDASSVTYVLAGQSHTVPTVGPEGAYLIVTKAAPKQLFDFTDGGTNDVVPVDGPITALHYRDGTTCHLTSRSWIGGADACTPTLKVPVGYVPPKRTVYTSAQVAAPLRVRLLHATRGGYEITVSFTSRVAITHARSKLPVPVARAAHAPTGQRLPLHRQRHRRRPDREHEHRPIRPPVDRRRHPRNRHLQGNQPPQRRRRTRPARRAFRGPRPLSVRGRGGREGSLDTPVRLASRARPRRVAVRSAG